MRYIYSSGRVSTIMGAGLGGLGGRSSEGVRENSDGETDSDAEDDHLVDLPSNTAYSRPFHDDTPCPQP